MPYANDVLVGLAISSAIMSFLVVMFGGRSISSRAMHASEPRQDLAEFTMGWAGVLWFCALPVTIAALLLRTVPLLQPYMDDMELVIRLSILLHLLAIPGLAGIASLIAGSDQEVEV